MTKKTDDSTPVRPRRGHPVMDGATPFSVILRQTPSNDVYTIVRGAGVTGGDHAEAAREHAAELVAKGGIAYVLTVTAILTQPEKPVARELPLEGF